MRKSLLSPKIIELCRLCSGYVLRTHVLSQIFLGVLQAVEILLVPLLPIVWLKQSESERGSRRITSVLRLKIILCLNKDHRVVAFECFRTVLFHVLVMMQHLWISSFPCQILGGYILILSLQF